MGSLATTHPLSAFSQLGASDTIRVGLVGCGGRGTGAVANALRADPGARLVAMGDVFQDYLDNSLNSLRNTADIAEKIEVDDANRFVGWDAYKHVMDSCDVVCLATSPHFRPLHVEYGVSKGVHLFVEKPVATDAPGLRRIWAACDSAKKQGTAVVSGLCYRYQFAKQETMRRVHEGEIGDLVAMQCTYNTGELWHRGRKTNWSDMEYQMRNWLYFHWLSGDHIAEQHIHSLDKCLWAIQDEPPQKVTSSGGRIKRTDDKFGDVYDHFNSVYEWENGVKLFSSCRQMSGTSHDVSDYIFGTKGKAAVQSHRISGENAWRWRSEGPDDMYQNEHDALFRSIRDGKPINDGDFMCKSTLLAIMARMSAYSGQSITWKQALNSEQSLTPAAYEWGPAPEVGVAVPGITKFS